MKECSFKELFSDAGNVWDVLDKLQLFLKEQFMSKRVKGNYDEDVFLGEGTIIEKGVLIKGPAIIGKNCFIDHSAYLRGGCLLGNNVHIGHSAEIKSSILLDNAAVSHLNYIGNSILGNSAHMSGGSIAANVRLDKKPVFIRLGDQKIKTGLQKFGSIIGDGSNIGVNAVLNPGTILGKNTIVYPLREVRGVHSEGETIK